jgi:hypothetical protein
MDTGGERGLEGARGIGEGRVQRAYRLYIRGKIIETNRGEIQTWPQND